MNARLHIPDHLASIVRTATIEFLREAISDLASPATVTGIQELAIPIRGFASIASTTPKGTIVNAALRGSMGMPLEVDHTLVWRVLVHSQRRGTISPSRAT